MVVGIDALAPLQFGVPGGMELAVILLIAVLLFGANKIPKLARSTGQAMGEFRRGHEEVKQELEEMQQGGAATAETATAEESGRTVEQSEGSEVEQSESTAEGSEDATGAESEGEEGTESEEE